MKILILSDSHGKTENLEQILKTEADCDMIVHLGDGAGDLDFCLPYTAHKQVWRVKGNCDPFACGFQESHEIAAEGVTVFACHGHRYNAHFGLQNLYYAALSCNANVVLYGHTHLQKADTADDILFLNPGAVKDGRFALLFAENGNIRYELK